MVVQWVFGAGIDAGVDLVGVEEWTVVDAEVADPNEALAEGLVAIGLVIGVEGIAVMTDKFEQDGQYQRSPIHR
jgi:hypothetical protein